jgi:hypothetical protein
MLKDKIKSKIQLKIELSQPVLTSTKLGLWDQDNFIKSKWKKLMNLNSQSIINIFD